MNIENRAVKAAIKDLPPVQALALFDEYKIPSPYKEILTIVCVRRIRGFKAMDTLDKEYQIFLGYWTFVRRLKDALEMFRKADKNACTPPEPLI